MVVGVLILILTDSRPRLAATNSRVTVSGVEVVVLPGEERCQGGEFVPRQAAALRIYAGGQRGQLGQPLVVSILDQKGRMVSRAQVPAGYGHGSLDIRMPPPSRDVNEGSFCLRNSGAHPMTFAGNLTTVGQAEAQRGSVGPEPQILATTVNPFFLGPNGPGARRSDEIRVDYLRPGRESWLELAPVLARRFALFKPSFFGPWTLWAALASMVLLWALAALLVTRSGDVTPTATAREGASTGAHDGDGPRPGWGRRARRWLPAAGWGCTVIAFLHGAVWATVTPAFQVPDESAHAGYVQYLAEKGRPPPTGRGGSTAASRREALATGNDLSEEHEAIYFSLPFGTEAKPSWSQARDEALRRRLNQDLSQSTVSGARSANSYPPLYYAVEALPVRLASGLDALDRLYLMRLVSALFAAATVAFVYLFLRELLPATPWARTVGALAVAFQPVFGFMSGGVNNDNLLYTAGAALVFALARALRRGLTPRLGIGIAVAVAVGMLTKPGMIALVPGAAVGVALAAWRSPARRPALLGTVAAAGTLAAVGLAFVLLNTVVLGRATVIGEDLVSEAAGRLLSMRGQASYLWQFFLPQLPFMAEQFPAYPSYPVWDVYIQGFIGRFGYFQYGFPPWANNVGLAVLGAVTALAGLALARTRGLLRRRWPELACYGLLLVGLMILNAVVGYRSRALTGANFEQPRYLFPLLALYGGLVAVAARGAGRHWGPALGAFLVVLAVGHSLFAILLTIARYYA